MHGVPQHTTNQSRFTAHRERLSVVTGDQRIPTFQPEELISGTQSAEWDSAHSIKSRTAANGLVE
jgi:hypothetical protein